MTRTSEVKPRKSEITSFLIFGGLALLAFDAYMSLAMTGFLVPQMVLALIAISLIVAGVILRTRS